MDIAPSMMPPGSRPGILTLVLFTDEGGGIKTAPRDDTQGVA